MFNLQDVNQRNWLAGVLVFTALAVIFGLDLLRFHIVGTTTDVVLILGGAAQLGIHVSYTTGLMTPVPGKGP